MPTHSSRLVLLTVVVVFLIGGGSLAQAAINVWMDFAGFDTRLNELAVAATIDPFTIFEQTIIRSNIQSQLGTIYSDFDVSFSTTTPGGSHESLLFGATTGNGGLLGEAQEIDWLNFNWNDSANIYTANFGFILDEFDAANNRADQLSQLSTALAGTAAHELGHNLGLQHPEAYGDWRIGPGNYTNTQGFQNDSIMATGGTGLGETGRETLRHFNTLETARLEFDFGLTASNAPTYVEPIVSHATAGTAVSVDGFTTHLSISNVDAWGIYGELDAPGQFDYYRFTGLANERITASIISVAYLADPIDSYLTLFGPDGSTVLLTNDNITYSGNTFNNGGDYSSDSMLLNYLLPQDGDYYLRVSDSGTGTGNYGLLVTQDESSVPEPATLVLMSLGLAGAGYKLRRRKQR